MIAGLLAFGLGCFLLGVTLGTFAALLDHASKRRCPEKDAAACHLNAANYR